MGAQYGDTKIDISAMSGVVGSMTPRVPQSGGGDGNNRHAAAWEDVSEALMLIADCMDMMGCPNGAKVRELATQSKMENMRSK